MTCDIPSAFMQADIDEILHLKLMGKIAELLVKLHPSYSKFITYENGKTVIYVTEFRQPLQVQSHLEMPRILVQLGHTQRT